METLRVHRYRIAIGAFIALLFLALPSVRTFLVYRYEDIRLAVAPSAALAARLGDRHLDAQGVTSAYDIDRASHLYEKALTLDPKYPYIHHQLARVEFLRGNFNLAILHINEQIELYGDAQPDSYYVSGLIKGYAGRYADAATDYEHYLQFDPYNWAAMNDYAWVLLKLGRAHDAANVTNFGLQYHPDNAWLLNSNAAALFEFGLFDQALDVARRAEAASKHVSEQEWLMAYPGNDPKIANMGLQTFRQATEANVHKLESLTASVHVQSE